MIDWDLMRVVLAIHRRGSMAGASELLGIDRATVLRRLDALEGQLQSRLFERRPDGCLLTPAGRNIIGLVEGVEQAMTALELRVEGEDTRVEGRVCVAAPLFLIESVIAPALPTVRAAYPALDVELRADFESLDLARADADIALRFSRPANDAVIARRAGSIAIGLFASETYSRGRGMPQGGDLQGHDLLLLDGPLGHLPCMGWPLAQLSGARVVLRSDEPGPLVAAAAAGAGIACVPVVAAIAAPNLHALSPGIVGRAEIYLATHRDLRTRARVKSVFDLLARLFTQRAADLTGALITERFDAAQPSEA